MNLCWDDLSIQQQFSNFLNQFKIDNGYAYNITLCEKRPYSEFFWSIFSRIKSPYLVRMQENTDQNNSEYGNISRSVNRQQIEKVNPYESLISC